MTWIAEKDMYEEWTGNLALWIIWFSSGLFCEWMTRVKWKMYGVKLAF